MSLRIGEYIECGKCFGTYELEVLSYEAADKNGVNVTVDQEYVDKHLGELVKDEDLTRYIL